MLSVNTRRKNGFSLIELIVAVAILGVLLALGLPNFNQWLTNMRLRNHAEFVMSGIQQARGEALKRNSIVRFQLVTDMTTDCAIQSTSNLWIVSHGDPTSNCDLAANVLAADTTGNDPNSTAPVILISSVLDSATSTNTVTNMTVTNGVAAAPHLCFAGTGALTRVSTDATTGIAAGLCTASLNPATTATVAATINISDPTAGACFSDAGASPTGTIRCLQIRVSSWGEVRMCDPGLTAVKHVGDPRVCS